MKVIRAVGVGLIRALGSPALVLLVWSAVLLFALPWAVMMQQAIEVDVGSSLIHENLRHGLDLGWLEEFQHRRGGLAESLTPSALSSVAALDNLERWFTGDWLTHHRGLAVSGLSFVLAWVFLQGGVISHFAQPGLSVRLAPFFSAAGAHFLRFFRLAVLVGAAYFGVYRFARWLFPEIEQLTRDVTVEKTALLWHLGGVLVVLLLMSFIHLVSDYAKMATVREQRRSMVVALIRSLGLVVTHPLQALGLFGVISLLLLAVQGAYFRYGPDLSAATPMAIVLAFLAGQVYLLARWTLRLALLAGELELFDGWTRHGRLR